MIIDSLIIEGFSNIEHIRLDIGEINALITPNSYGKSNVLSAISFSLMYLNANEETKGQMLFLVLRRSSIFISQLIVTYGLKSVVQFVYDIFNFM
jgi:AAA15 family ATPase/GTPase